MDPGFSLHQQTIYNKAAKEMIIELEAKRDKLMAELKELNEDIRGEYETVEATEERWPGLKETTTH
tara:strand:- start:251 stop:448 length:198 start_codon:yes stop_codon:yes gene_type:complete